MPSKRAALLLLPNLLSTNSTPELYLPGSVGRAVTTLDGLIAESASGGRRFLGHFLSVEQALALPIAVVDGKTVGEDLDFFLAPIIDKGERWGYVSDGGLPCIADPGARLVRRARQRGIAVQAFIGPSALFLGLMLSGLPAQRFAFHGYLPKKSDERRPAIKRLQERSKSDDATQIAIESPHRNEHLLEDILATLAPETLLCVAWQLTEPGQAVVCQSIATWRKSVRPNLHDKQAVFYIYAGSEV